MVRFFCLSSGSCGNCYYLGTEQMAIIIDAGIPYRDIKEKLQSRRLWSDKVPVWGLFITHDHTDHIRATTMLSTSKDMPIYGKGSCLPVYATKTVHGGMDKNYGLSKNVPRENRKYLEYEKSVELSHGNTTMNITPFPVPHDSRDNVGYYIEVKEDRGVQGTKDGKEVRDVTITKFCIATDVGCVTLDIVNYLSKADHIVIESNHDIDMLMNGSYPARLKARVRGDGGHLSNVECAELLCQVWHPEIRNIWLCHISKDNNIPSLAYMTVKEALIAKGVDVTTLNLTAIPYGGATDVVNLSSDEIEKYVSNQYY